MDGFEIRKGNKTFQINLTERVNKDMEIQNNV